ncbi:MAG: ABC transporter ATP-binding protein [Nitrososphaerota archaeon]
MAIIEINDLSFQYYGKKQYALEKINLEINEGELVLILGRSGSGKSTLIKCINGLIPNRYEGNYNGNVFVDGIKIKGASLAKLSEIVGTIMQEVGKQLIISNVEDDVAFGPCNLGLPYEEVKNRVYDALESVKAFHLKDRDVNELSGGEKQRVAIAGVLAMNPKIILMDEPLANLDSEGVRLIQEQIKKFHKNGKTIIIAEHRAEEILNIGVDRIIIMDNGKIIKETENEEDLLIFSNSIKIPARIFLKNKVQNIEEITFPIIPKPSIGNLAVKFENVSFSYNGKLALKNINLEIYEGEKIALLGNNGAGKSTLSKLMLGLLKPTSGRIFLYGMDIRKKEVYEIAPYIGLVFQDPFNMLFAKTVREELSYGPKNINVPIEEINKRIEETVKSCNIEHLIEYSPFASSYGEKKRICVGSILTMLPKILILDEPTAGQDYFSYTSFMNFVLSLKDKVRTFILITHDTDLAIEYSDRTIILADGCIIADGPTREILANPENLEKGKIRETSLVETGRKITNGKMLLKMDEIKNLYGFFK